MKTCKHCSHDEPQCLSKSQKGYLCTLPKGHYSEHVACGERRNGNKYEHVVRDVWNDVAKNETSKSVKINMIK